MQHINGGSLWVADALHGGLAVLTLLALGQPAGTACAPSVVAQLDCIIIHEKC